MKPALLAVAIGAMVWLRTTGALDVLVTRALAAGPLGVLAIAALAIPAALLFVPLSILNVAAGFVGGTIPGAVLLSIGGTLGAMAAFGLGRTLARRRLEPWLARDERLSAIDRRLERAGLSTVLLLRLTPVFPRNLLSYALALTSVSFADFVVGTWFGSLPSALLSCWLGASLRTLPDLHGEAAPGRGALAGVSIAASALGLLALARLRRRSLPPLDAGRPRVAPARART